MSERMSDERLAQLEATHSLVGRFNHVIELVDAVKAEREEVERLRFAWAGADERAAQAEARLTRLVERLNEVLGKLSDTPEINPSNYDHEDVCALNDGMIEVHNLLTAALAEATRGRPVGPTSADTD